MVENAKRVVRKVNCYQLDKRMSKGVNKKSDERVSKE